MIVISLIGSPLTPLGSGREETMITIVAWCLITAGLIYAVASGQASF